MYLVFSSLEYHSKKYYEVETLRLLLSVKFSKAIFKKWAYIRRKVVQLGKINFNDQKKYQLLVRIFLTRDHYKFIAEKVRKGYGKELQKWVEEMEKKLIEHRRSKRMSPKKGDIFVENNQDLFQTELTSGSPVAYRLLQMLMASEISRGQKKEKGRKSGDEYYKKRKLVRGIMRLQKEEREKKNRIMIMIGLIKSFDPLFVKAKMKVFETKEKLKKLTNHVKGPKNIEKMEKFIGKDGMFLLNKKSKIRVNIYKNLIEELDKEGINYTQDLKTKASKYQNFFGNHRDLVYQLVKMNRPLFRLPPSGEDQEEKLIEKEDTKEKEPEKIKEIVIEEEPQEDFEESVDILDEIIASLGDPTPPPSPPKEPTPIPTPPRKPSPVPTPPRVKTPEPEFTPDQVRNDILKYINQYRKDPNSAINDMKSKSDGNPSLLAGANLNELSDFLSNLGPLEGLNLDGTLSNSAKDHCPDLIKTRELSKKGIDGSMPEDRVKRYGKCPKILNESLSLGMKSGQDIVLKLLADIENRKNVLGNDFKILGLHVQKADDGTFACVIDFGNEDYEEEKKVIDVPVIEPPIEVEEIVEKVEIKQVTPPPEPPNPPTPKEPTPPPTPPRVPTPPPPEPPKEERPPAPPQKPPTPEPEEESEDEGFPSLEAMLGSTKDEFKGLVGERAKYETEVLGIDASDAAKAEDFELEVVEEEKEKPEEDGAE